MFQRGLLDVVREQNVSRSDAVGAAYGFQEDMRALRSSGTPAMRFTYTCKATGGVARVVRDVFSSQMARSMGGQTLVGAISL